MVSGQRQAAPRRERLPDTRNSITHKFSVAGHEGYITVGLYEDGRPGELFITMAKEGSTIGGLMDCFGTAVSMSWQYGVPLEVYVNKFSHTRFEPMGHTKNPDIRLAKSIVDYIFRWLGITFMPGFREASAGMPPTDVSSGKQPGEDAPGEVRPAAMKAGGLNGGPGLPKSQTNGNVSHKPEAQARPHKNGVHKSTRQAVQSDAVSAGAADLLERAGLLSPEWKLSGDTTGPAVRSDQFASFQTDAPACDNCGAITVRNGNCYLWHNCGNSMGCS